MIEENEKNRILKLLQRSLTVEYIRAPALISYVHINEHVIV